MDTTWLPRYPTNSNPLIVTALTLLNSNLALLPHVIVAVDEEVSYTKIENEWTFYNNQLWFQIEISSHRWKDQCSVVCETAARIVHKLREGKMIQHRFFIAALIVIVLWLWTWSDDVVCGTSLLATIVSRHKRIRCKNALAICQMRKIIIIIIMWDTHNQLAGIQLTISAWVQV